ncbi:MAG: acyl transferase [Saprospiraceae bacterium]|nr:acyl transferase [Saprospiraceae bacterium]
MQTPGRADLLPMLANLTEASFEATAEAVFAYQSVHNSVYSKYLGLLGHSNIQRPFLPISFFKTHRVQTGIWEAETEFNSSGTSGQTPSRHLVRHLDFYLKNASEGFAQYYGDPSKWAILALLPSYLEREGSSLVAMADYFIQNSQYEESGFFLNDFGKLKAALSSCKSKDCKILLLGVSFALLDFAERCPMDLNGVTIMETGGMKGRRRELTRTELHETLKDAFGVNEVHSEYGMTELFSQAYALGDSRFRPTKTMRVFANELNDPFCPVSHGRTGVLNIIDLANLDTCSFIQTEDIGRVFSDGSFEVLGRMDVAEMRGCNLMVE